ncbi:MAG: hypothetical protein JO307_21385 [Bryobacterales bacterium]|nr:hypothetical protein [Bryobacterales bacterium]MBV9399144.1 hypothetical protein [Bryobacterales bacterium]
MSATHEDFGREVHRSGPSDRNFGLVISAAFLIIGILPLRHGKPVRLWGLALSIALLGIALLRPATLKALNRVWMKIGLLLGKALNPIVTALLFFLVFTPAGIILRWMRKDLLALQIDPGAETYWIDRTASGPVSTMADQF